MGLFDGMFSNGGWLGQLTPYDAQQAQDARDAAYEFSRGTGRRMQNPADRGSWLGDAFGSVPWRDLLTFQGGTDNQTPASINPAYARLADAFGSSAQAAPPQPNMLPPLAAPRNIGLAPGMNAPSLPPQLASSSVQTPQQMPPQASQAMAQAQPAPSGGGVAAFLDAIRGGMDRAARVLDPSQRPQFGQVGTDIAGNAQYGWVDPINMTVNGQGLGAGAGSPFGGSVGFPRDASGQPLQGEDLLDHLKKTDPTAASMVQAIVRGDAAVTGRNLQKYMPIATLVDPSLQQFNYDIRKKTALDFAPSGKSALNVKALETAGGHLSKMMEAYDKIGNGQFPAFNQLRNWITTQTGGGAPGGFDTFATGVANELGTVFRSYGMSDSEVKSWRDRISNSASPEQFNENMHNLMDMLKTRRAVIADQYQSGMGKELPNAFPKLDAAIAQAEKRFTMPGGPQAAATAPIQGVTKSGIKWSVQ